ncbi:WG repeat protein [Tenacibaculum adriaticum]|uniref:WG repeat protein n=1 Tax=Tenacibaculum adriaticum TaxID=413713 RepID=A0A5S5DYZ5_9FLAO|nr:WG repeat-containing protein [Tenacibaculum adriaticum]TYQ00257.1 WG repeat protein [Tenacibaculum adriaticum]
MKNLIILITSLIVLTFEGFSQNIDNIDFISPFNDDVAAIKKGNQWGFINIQGDLVIPFRDDLVATNSGNNNYPVFNDNRCLISTTKDGISYFGYIDKQGKTVIKPQFLNATPFNNNNAIALKLDKEDMGENAVLGKHVVSYSYANVIIDNTGKDVYHLTKFKYVPLSSKIIKNPPKITTKLISDKLYAVEGENGKWEIKKMEK